MIKVTLTMPTDNEDDTLNDVRDWAEQVEQHGCIDSYGYVFDISDIGVAVYKHGTGGVNE